MTWQTEVETFLLNWWMNLYLVIYQLKNSSNVRPLYSLLSRVYKFLFYLFMMRENRGEERGEKDRGREVSIGQRNQSANRNIRKTYFLFSIQWKYNKRKSNNMISENPKRKSKLLNRIPPGNLKFIVIKSTSVICRREVGMIFFWI